MLTENVDIHGKPVDCIDMFLLYVDFFSFYLFIDIFVLEYA
jgi:hypothetical protein